MVDDEVPWQPTLFHVHLAAIVRRGDEILIMKRAVGALTEAWYFPAGGLEENESPEEGILREIREETELEVDQLRLFRVSHTRQPDGTPAVALTYVCEVSADVEPVLNVEHSEYRWIAALEYRDQYFSDDVLALVADSPSLQTLVEGIRGVLDAYIAEYGS